MTDEPIKKTYRDVEIIYVEREDKWNFTVNGRERNSDSLAQAKESIDRSLDYEKKERPWKPFAAYHQDYNRDFEPVTVTSVADKGHGSAAYYWISKVKGRDKKRSKESEFELFAATPENEQKIARWRELNAEIRRLDSEKRQLVHEMEHVKAPEAAEKAAG